MLRVLSPTYDIRVTVKDAYKTVDSIAAAGGGSLSPHKFFDSANGKTGCDEALAAVRLALSKAGIEADVWLERFSHT